MPVIERTPQGDQFIFIGLEATREARAAALRQVIAETEAKRQAARRMKDWHCAGLLEAEIARLVRLHAQLEPPRQASLF